MDYDIATETYVEMKRFGDDVLQLGHRTAHLRYEGEDRSAAAASYSRWPDGSEVFSLRFPSRAAPRRFVDHVNEDDNIHDTVVTHIPDGSGDAGILGTESEEVEAETFEAADDLISVTAGYQAGEGDRYRLSYGNHHHGDAVSDAGASTVSIIGRDLADAEEAVARYVTELHRDAFSRDEAVDLVETALDAFPDGYDEVRWMTRGVPGTYTFPSHIPIED